MMDSVTTCRLAGWTLAISLLATTASAQETSEEPTPGAAEEAGEEVSETSTEEGEVAEVLSDEADVAEDPQMAEARERFRAGLTLARAGNCEGALAEFRTALDLVERPNILFNMARCHEELFRYDLAIATYERYLTVAPADAPDRPAVDATMRQLRNLLGTVVVRSNVPAEVWIGDRIVGEAPGEVMVPGGRHAIELRAAGYVPERREVEVAGRQRIEVEVSLSEAQVTNVTEITEEHTTVEVTEEGGAPPALFYTGVGLTAASLAAGLAFGAVALGNKSTAESLNPYDYDAIVAANNATADAALLADIFFITAAVLGVTTVVLYFLTDFDGDPEEHADERTFTPVVAIGPDLGAVGVQGAF
ncbi:MAG: hypothetical protein DRJ42_14715 [Deltaproteobacteria bacterium]|nr:MAG: hypothetical protein DRJ42_14715 [Deltaproteobacteria bacterium]